MKHTKGPWKTIVLDGEMWINPDRPSGEWALICRVNGRTVKGSTRPAEPNADRIVACVNGCDAAGIVDPSKLAGYQGLVAAVDSLLDHHRTYENAPYTDTWVDRVDLVKKALAGVLGR